MAYSSFEDLEIWKRARRIAVKIGLVDKAAMEELVDAVVRISKMTHSLINSLKAKSKCPNPT